MKLLHMGDLHAGRMLYGVSRLGELSDVLTEIVGLIQAQYVDYVLIAGDIYDQRNPPPEAEQLIYDFLRRVYDTGAQTILIAGNHDSPQRWAAVEEVLRKWSVHVVPELRRPDEGGTLLFNSGREALQVAAIPWVSERIMTSGIYEEGAARRTYTEAMRVIMESFNKRFAGDCCRVVVAHPFISGAMLSGTERHHTASNTFAMMADDLPAEAQYVALGHIHQPQNIEGMVPTRYCGSPLQLDFGEIGQRKSVTIVTLEPYKPADVQVWELRAGRRLIEFTTAEEELDANLGIGDDHYIRVYVHCDQVTPGLSDRVKEMYPTALTVRTVCPREI